MKEKKGEIRFNVALNIVAITALAIFRLTPIIHRNIPAVYYMALYVFWLLTTFGLPKGKRYPYVNQLLIPWMALLVWQVFLRVVGFSTISYVGLIMKLTLFTVPAIIGMVINKYNKREIRLLLVSMFLVIFTNVLSNIIICLQDPDLVVQLSNLETAYWKFTNLGRTTFVVMCLFFLAYCFVIFRGSKQRVIRTIAMVSLLLTAFYMGFQNTRGTDVILGIVMIVALLYITQVSSQKKKNRSGYYLLGLVLIVVVVWQSSNIFGALENVFSEDMRMLTRLTDIETLMMSGTDQLDDGSLSTRLLLYSTSIGTFFGSLSNFIFGVGDVLEDASDLMVLLRVGIGGHSEFFDAMAKFGIIGSLMYVWVLSSYHKFFKKLPIEKIGISMWKTTFFIFIFYSFINTSFHSEVFFLIFLAIPLAIYYYFNKETRYVQ
mgnify:CR=1 FL=1